MGRTTIGGAVDVSRVVSSVLSIDGMQDLVMEHCRIFVFGSAVEKVPLLRVVSLHFTFHYGRSTCRIAGSVLREWHNDRRWPVHNISVWDLATSKTQPWT
ncbi:hypothetical protein TNCT_236231 [Trichonephila clavata]|uniref:Uncharacterized protein n=1 Tax=Trichonephila clavata TaxID=2740835 RepID=A0A8X6LBQ8_TRICU|nr:hypothetical protein TNCT_236231 [Trichonephila clavata]